MTNPIYMATVSNVIIDLNEFKELDVKLFDIATVLNHINRYNGHTKQPYSVLEHSMLVCCIFADHYKDKISFDNAMACLLHDAAEVYIGDVISPMKVTPEFEFFRDMDTRISGIIYKAFGMDIDKVDWDLVKNCDKQACYIESTWFFANLPGDFFHSIIDVDLNDYPNEGFGNTVESFNEIIKLVYKKYNKEVPETII